MGPGRLAIVLVLAACGATGPVSPGSHDRPTLRVVRCTPATPPPVVASEPEVAVDDRVREPWLLGRGRRDRATVPSGFRLGKRAAVSLGVPSITGSLGRDPVTAVVRARLGELKTCYANEPSNSSLAKAIVVYRFTIARDGKVMYANASAQVSGSLDGCVKRVLRALVFPVPPGGDSVIVSLPVVFDSTGTLVPPEGAGKPTDAEPWTPFAHTGASTPAAAGAARVSEAAMRARLAAMEACFTGPTPTGSLRVMLDLDVMGELGTVRVGGLGDAAVEACLAGSLAGLHVVTPIPAAVEVACDVARGDAQPWRIAPTAGYDLIEADRARLHHGATVVIPGASDPEPLPSATYVIVAQPDTPGAMLQLALMWANDAETVMLALRDGRASPLFLGLGHTAVAQGDDDLDVVRPALRVGAKMVTGCVGRGTHQAALSDPAGVGSLVQRLATRCRTLGCSPTLLVAIDSDAVARDLVEITGAARRAGFDRVLLGGSELGCQLTPRAPAERRPLVDGPDFE
jgi:hypothetical protein